mmetsp:Transcript_24640/g.53807  ORF Transcript_24640/g.53807 Transcript_24640/m.53807 type:complete len:416 (+) Transcript_24640:194-1441(+)|eukprot:CAMPEP_0202889904 /NCGR_PEP_ID=MMETSP1392-20130828/447_1 /ASSEMBLY_ACC=CAM_ASM_000868 /TAXON_ID=225041 /ORGANISM="Chlamydomonas chlamydogama, Strain SAG 11-48b" /LENGTH=415 /DNA_ID=CAMNT_0049573343 /DNA_START=163 /DNA_END=1410 /DNA_ORIENTATION=-
MTSASGVAAILEKATSNSPKRVSSGSYLATQQLRDAYQKASPSKLAPVSMRLAGSPSQEVSFLRAEIQRLQQLNVRLQRKMEFLEARVPGLGRALSLEQCMEGTDGAVEVKAVPHPGRDVRSSPLKGGDSEAVELLGPPLLDDLMLSSEEVEEGAMRCCWVAHYWHMANQLDMCTEVAGERSAYWQSMAMPHEVFLETVKRAVAPYMPAAPVTDAASAEPGTAAATSVSEALASADTDATVGDIVEVERAMRQLQELGIIQEVGCTLAHRAALAQSSTLVVSPELQPYRAAEQVEAAYRLAGSSAIAPAPFDPEDPALPLNTPAAYGQQAGPSLSALEQEEVHFQKAWLAYMWSRAAGAGVEPQVARVRAETWGRRLEEVPSPRDFTDLAAALQELYLLGVEQQLWQRRNAALTL